MTAATLRRVGPRVLLPFLCLIAACGGGDDDGLPDGVAAVADADTLTQAQLQGLLEQAPQIPAFDDARSLVHTWVDLALLSAALDADSTLAAYEAEAMATEIDAYAIRDFAARRSATGRSATAEEVDSVIRGDQVRSFEVYSIHGDPRVDSVAFIDAIRTLENLRQAAIAGGGDIRAAYEALPGATRERFDLVRLPAVSRRDLPGNLSEQLWPLAVGEMTPVIAGGPGVQIIVRQNTADFRDDIANWLRPQLQMRDDARVVDSIVAAHDFELAADAVSRARSAMAEPGTVAGTAPLATWQGGELTPEEATLRIGGLAPNQRAILAGAPDTVVATRLTQFGRAELLHQVVAGDVTPERLAEHKAMAHTYWTSSIDTLRAGRALLGEDGRTPLGWLQAVVSGRATARELPGMLGGTLRQRATVRTDSLSMARAVAEAARVWTAPTP